MHRRRAAFILLCALACAAFALSLLPEQAKMALHTKGSLHPWFHFGLFFVLGALVILASIKTPVRVLLLAGASLLGLAIEYTEALRFHAGFEVYDVITDIYGVLFGALVTHLLSRKTR